MKKVFDTKIDGVTIRYVEEGEENIVLHFIKEIAAYEKMSDQVVATEEGLHKAIFEQHACNCLLVEKDNEFVGFCLFFHTFSTFCGRTNMYLEDIYLDQSVRGLGIGKEIFRVLMEITVEEGCDRLEWVCLNWNTPSIGFYKKLGAFPMSDWTTWRMTTKELTEALEKMK